MKTNTKYNLISFALAVLLFIVMVMSEPDRPPKEPRKPNKLPTTEDVGRAAGKHTRKFGRGFIEGFRKERETK